MPLCGSLAGFDLFMTRVAKCSLSGCVDVTALAILIPLSKEMASSSALELVDVETSPGSVWPAVVIVKRDS